ncbi:MAG: malectin domain-containing carbohydrate-binding protein, partial [Vicinamibacteria bacterium]
VVERRVPLKSLKHVAVTHAAALLMVLPFLLPLLREVAEGESYLRVDFHHIFSADLLSFVLPPEHHPVVGQWVTATYHRFNTDYRERVNYLGLSLLFLSAYGLIRPAGKKRRTNTFWWVALIAFCGLALGPFLQVRGNTYESIVLPFELFRDLPFFNIMRAPTRFVSLATLCVAVLAGLGTLSLLKDAAKRSYGRTPIREATITGCLVVIVLFDVWTWPAWPLSAASMPPFYDELARERRDYAILEVPLPHIFNPLPLYYQTAHEKKLVGGYVSRPPQEAERFINANPFLASLVEPDRKYTGYILAREAENAYEILSTHDIEWVVVHNVGTSPAASLIAQWLSGVYDGPDHSANGLQAFRVDPAVGRERFLDSPHVSDEGQLPASLYASEWFGLESYRVSLPVGRYRVRLKFAEIFFDRPGERVFSVRIEGQDALRDFDIVKEVGALTPIDKDFDVYVEDGVLDIDFDAVRNLAKLSGLEIWRNGETVFATSAGDEVDHPWDGSHGYTGPAGFYRTRRAMESVPR